MLERRTAREDMKSLGDIKRHGWLDLDGGDVVIRVKRR